MQEVIDIKKQAEYRAFKEREAHDQFVQMTFALYVRLLDQEYSRGRSAQLKAKDKKLDIDVTTPLKVAHAATREFMKSFYGKPTKEEVEAAKETRKETEAGADAAPAAEAKSPGGIIVPE